MGRVVVERQGGMMDAGIVTNEPDRSTPAEKRAHPKGQPASDTTITAARPPDGGQENDVRMGLSETADGGLY
jgi:hypothetical protein